MALAYLGLNLDAREIPISAVTVYNDRAEVIRKFKVNLKPGFNEIQLENVPNYIQKDSIQVGGQGNATIHEVNYESKLIKTKPLLNSSEESEIREKIKSLESEIQKEKNLQSIYNTRIETLNNFVKNVWNNINRNEDRVVTLSFDHQNATAFNNIFEFHEEKIMEIKAKIIDSEGRILSHKNQCCALVEKVCERKRYINVISIQIKNEADNDFEVALTLTYQVSNARWSTAYDIHVKSEINKHQMELNYYGKITQKTGEDWNNAELSLSTAQPALGRNLPELGSTFIEFQHPPKIPYYPQSPTYTPTSPSGRAASPTYSTMSPSYGARSPTYGHTPTPSPEPSEIKQEVTFVEDEVLSSTFKIPSKMSIPSDNTEHKVTIAILNLATQLHHHCVPKKNTNVFLMAAVINDSDYPLISGPATVYLNNSMSTKIDLKSASCGEKFDVSLGVDKSVKVIYKPKHKFQTKAIEFQRGMIAKIKTTTIEKRIIVKRSKKAAGLLLTLHEPFPKSTHENIKVSLVSPLLNNTTMPPPENDTHGCPAKGAILDDMNNLLWTKEIGENEEEFLIKYSIEHPQNKSIKFFEQHQKE